MQGVRLHTEAQWSETDAGRWDVICGRRRRLRGRNSRALAVFLIDDRRSKLSNLDTSAEEKKDYRRAEYTGRSKYSSGTEQVGMKAARANTSAAHT